MYVSIGVFFVNVRKNMRIFDNITNFFRPRKKAEVSTVRRNPTGYEVASYGGMELSTVDKKKFIDAMEGWVYACVSAIADEVASIKLKLYELKGDDVEEVKEHTLLDVLYKVNSFTAKFDHFWLTSAYLDLAGESPWFVEKDNATKEPSALYFLRPDRLKPIPDKQKVIIGYEYQVDMNDKMRLGIDEVIFLKNPNPSNPFRGKGTLEYAARTVDIDTESEKWNFNFFKNEARPDMVLTIKDMDQMNEEQKEKLKKSLEKHHRGTDKAHRVMALFGDMDIQPFGFSQKDMDFTEQMKFGRDKIMAMFRVPKAIIAQTEGVNFASSKVAQYNFAKFTIKPKMERIVQQLNEFYLPMFKNTEKMFLDYENPVPEDTEMAIKKYESGIKSGWLTINEVREFENLEPIEGFDVPWMPFNLTPADEQKEELPEKPEEEEGEKKSIYDNKNINIERIRQLRARSGRLIDFDKDVKNMSEKLKDLVRADMKRTKNGKSKIEENSNEVNIIKQGLLKLLPDKKEKEIKEIIKEKIIVVKTDKTKKEYEEKLVTLNSKLEKIDKIKVLTEEEKNKIIKEKDRLAELRKDLVNEYNNQQDAK